ncbi:MAG: ABC transporter ATP-binding protein [Candidatus Cloacimonetes bacterium]|jgi:lipoprotein-releasing system ATP-binding protein|nr:ABC transporter ATP-binding protein [Candidatus Cloacimonadota bacterium]MBT6994293.1 ABC transporter ATP-binding protein [Candidatus Cloacimonadota bacterium]MBT7469162.1 ABC transporter ATP-binding protein [Candidatus Cloacimonadota bacterium]
MSILRVENLRKSFWEISEKLEILKDVNLTVEKGEKIAITGESGSGKSTLLYILGMLDTADSGEILYSNEIPQDINQFRNQKIGFVFQSHYLLADFTMLENVAIPHFLHSRDYKKSLQKAENLLKILDIWERKNHYPNQLSGGEQQRTAVARALINDPEIVFADEPTGNLDVKHSADLIDFIINLNETQSQTFIIVTHDLEIAKKMDKHYKLVDGILQIQK